MDSDNLSEQQISSAIQRILSRIDSTTNSALSGFPNYAEADGTWVTSRDGDWTGGFWVGELWLSAHISGGDLETVKSWMKRLQARTHSSTIFRGFLFYYGAVLGATLLQSTEARELAVAGALELAKDAHPCGIIGLGNAAEEASDVGPCETSIDGVGGVTGLLSYAAQVTDSSALADLALAHARWHLDHLVREDGSVVQSATFDPESGSVTRTYTHKGFASDSTWARAQAWAMLGATEAALWIPEHRAEFVHRARMVADWWLAHVPESGIPVWDFDAPNDGTQEIDTSAAAIAAACLLKLAELDRERYVVYHDAAARTVANLVRNHLTSEVDAEQSGMLVRSCYNHRIGLATANEVIWGSYFLFESLAILQGRLSALAV